MAQPITVMETISIRDKCEIQKCVLQVPGYVTFPGIQKHAHFATSTVVKEKKKKKSPDDDAGPQVEVLVDNLKQLRLCFRRGAVGEQGDGQRVGDPDCIRHL